MPDSRTSPIERELRWTLWFGRIAVAVAAGIALYVFGGWVILPVLLAAFGGGALGVAIGMRP